MRSDVPPGALAVSAGPQRVIEEWTLHKREGTAAAEAASAALAGGGTIEDDGVPEDPQGEQRGQASEESSPA